MAPVLDFCGKPISIGCVCAYPCRRKSRMWLTTLRIDGIESQAVGVKLVGYGPTGRRTHTTLTSLCIVIEQPHATS